MKREVLISLIIVTLGLAGCGGKSGSSSSGGGSTSSAENDEKPKPEDDEKPKPEDDEKPKPEDDEKPKPEDKPTIAKCLDKAAPDYQNRINDLFKLRENFYTDGDIIISDACVLDSSKPGEVVLELTLGSTIRIDYPDWSINKSMLEKNPPYITSYTEFYSILNKDSSNSLNEDLKSVSDYRKKYLSCTQSKAYLGFTEAGLEGRYHKISEYKTGKDQFDIEFKPEHTGIFSLVRNKYKTEFSLGSSCMGFDRLDKQLGSHGVDMVDSVKTIIVKGA